MGITALDVLVLTVSALLFRWLYVRKSSHNGLPHPPGPPGLPLVGNLNDVPTDEPHVRYAEWSGQYNSDIIRLNVMGTNIIIINSLKVANDLFDKRSSIYNDRPYLTMLYDLVGMWWAMSSTPYGERFRDMRKAFHQDFNHESVKQFREMETKACHELLRRLTSRPERFMEDIRHMAGRIILRAAYGIDIESENDRYLEIAEQSLQALSATVNAGSYLVDSLPILKYLPSWFPGAKFKRQAEVWRAPVLDMLNEPFDYVKKRLAEGNAQESAATSLMEGVVKRSKDPKYMEDVVKNTLGSMYAGGADTTVSALGSFISAMVLHPKVQNKAQQEIDTVVGSERLPDYSDRDSLPYVDAIVNETLRWHPVVPLDIPHMLSADDVYNGYYLPKGSIIVGNSWAVLHDDIAYPDPSTFNPDRFIKDGRLNPDVQDPAVAAFGFGRRICPGKNLAKDSLWITIASILASFTIEKATDDNGRPITPSEEYESGLVSYPKPFKCSIYPRSEERAALISATVYEC
ncbi:unnamed protein product [Somion occarium]|uniref:Cytochrome P450 n=1 Tax=Somion occarium TaxID=3059160 RepID=A0ABP1E8I8_9APHY